MGLISAARERRAARERQLHEATYEEAIAQGESPEKATMAADQAVRERRRRRRIIFGAVG